MPPRKKAEPKKKPTTKEIADALKDIAAQLTKEEHRLARKAVVMAVNALLV